MTSVVPSNHTEELDALRRRAYGPDADILLDPVALLRLRQLEGETSTVASSGRATRPLDPSSSTLDAADAAPAAAASAGREAEGTVKEGAKPSPKERRWSRRAALWIAAGATITLVSAGALLAAWSSRPDITLTVPPGAVTPVTFPDSLEWFMTSAGIQSDSLRAYEKFGDVAVWAGEAKDGVECVLLTIDGTPIAFGCSRETDATADIVLPRRIAEASATGLPERSTIRAVFRGDRVDVWITEPSTG